ncbi:MAG: hypothetical protein KJ749_15350, partial [Planctomycetes bacterium]|nr:hypothetical protein [Planctomycetota bacterium]
GVGSIGALSVELMQIGGDLWAFVGGSTAGLRIVKVSDPSTPEVLDLDLPVGPYESASGVALHESRNGNKYAYVAAGGTVYVFDISNPRAAGRVGVLAVGKSLARVTATESALIVGTVGPDDVRIFDLSTPEAPEYQGSLSGYSPGLAARGDWLYIARGTSGLHVVDISEPIAPHVIATTPTPGSVLSVAISGDWAVLGDNDTVFDTVKLHPTPEP